ncbi:hypothetical protein EW093_01030 [Thiospirochaeta perfilievii]|uniref:Uncharacterized protein n=1 Tax=Thiospirochaeta perfilievii TaxID=252967 RepID=A0A5C1Q8Z4_9SPIO|nr:hypothetical protein [Thiospirochaeta perfilievii]QEN03346.1 hypothetical protein EW093_01030 [Thiospirochaeta perfilievii]
MVYLELDRAMQEKHLIDRTLFTRFEASYQFFTGRNKIYLYRVIEECERSFNLDIVCNFIAMSNFTYISTIINEMKRHEDFHLIHSMFSINSSFDIILKFEYQKKLGSEKLTSLLVELYSITNKIKSLKLYSPNWAYKTLVYNQYIQKSMDLYEDIAIAKISLDSE